MLLAYASPKAKADDWERAAARLAQAISTEADIVLLLGGSAARELTGLDAYYSAALSQACRRPILFVNVGTPAQSFIETWSLVRAVPQNRLSLAIVALNYSRFENTRNDVLSPIYTRRFPFVSDSESFDGEITANTRTPDPFDFLRNLSWLVRHARAFDWKKSKPSYEELTFINNGADLFADQRNAYAYPSLTFSQKKEIALAYIAQRYPKFSVARKESTVLWVHFAERVIGAGANTLFLALPESAAFKSVDDLLGADFEQSLASFQNKGAMIADWRHLSFLTESDFYDQQHLLASGRKTLVHPFLKLVKGGIRNCEKAEDAR